MIKHNLAVTLGAVLLAAGGTAAIGGAASATVTQGANGVIYGTGGTPQASFNAATARWTLQAPTSAGGSAQIDLVNPPSGLVAGADNWAPSFTAASSTATGIRFVVEYHDGCTLVGTPSSPGNSLLTWAEEPGGNPGMDWITATQWVQNTCGADDQTTAAFLEDTSSSAPVTVSINYNNETVTPYSSTTTHSAQGPVKNRKSGKCLDVTAGQFTAGTKLQQWTCGADGGKDQRFQIVTHDVNGALSGHLEAISPSGTVLYVSAPGGQLKLSASGGAADTDMLENQGYGQGVYTFPEAPGSTSSGSVVMDDSGASTANGAKIISYAFNNGSNQMWSLP